MRKLFIGLATLLAMAILCYAVMAANLYDDGEIVIDSTNLYPKTDAGSTLGKSGNEFVDVFTDAITLGGTQKTSWGSVVSPMTDASGYVYPTDSGGVYRLYDAGYLSLGAGTAIDVYILLDTDDDDWYIGRDDTDNDFAIGVGSTLGTDERISIVDSATLTHIVIGDNADGEDKYIIWDGNATDQYEGYLDTYDMVCFGDGSTMDADMAFGIENASTPLLVLWNGIDGYGAIDLDYGSADITDHTFVSDGGTLIIDGTITLTDSEVISNATDDTIRVASNDLDTVLEIYTPYDTTGDATLKLSADKGDAAGEQWTITSTGATTDLVIACDDSVSGTPITTFTIADNGVVTTIAAQNFEIDDSANTTVTDIVNIQHFTSGTAGAGIGAGLTFDLENDAGTEEEHVYVDAVATSAADGAEDTDVVIGQMTAGAVAETLRVVAASSATTSDYLQLTANTTETDAATNVLVLKTATGTAANNYGMSISFQPEDATGSEEKASIDIVQTTAARATNDTDFVFSQDVNGTITETLRLDADSGMTYASATASQPKLWLENTADDATCPVIQLENDRATEADGDDLGRISFYGSDDGDAASEFAYILAEATDITATKEAGKITMGMEINDTATAFLGMFGDAGDVTTGHFEINSGAADIDFHLDGNDQADLIATDADTDTIKFNPGQADSQILIAQADTTGTSGEELIYIDDDRTGTNANQNTEATIVIEAEGTHALYAKKGIVEFTATIVPTEDVTSTNIITASETGTTYFLNSATEFASTLPAISTVSAGTTFTFIVKAAPSAASYTVITGNSLENVLIGGINELEVDTGDDGPYQAAGDTITFVDSLAAVGDYVTMVSDGTSYYIRGQANKDGGITVTQAD